tara:strand:+ start:264 stop:1073 length:810 start_codon:yes stop_codon:yes gene_type:complete
LKHAISNIALPAHHHQPELSLLRELGVQGIEVAPSRIWEDTWKGLTADDVSKYRNKIEAADLEVVGLHSLLFDHRELELFGTSEQRDGLLEFFIHLSGVCRDLGGHTLIWGGGRHRGSVPEADAVDRTVSFFSELADRINGHGTCFCLEPLAPNDTDFIHSVLQSQDIVRAVGHPSLRVQIDAKALAANNELSPATFAAVAGDLVHFHANEPDFEILGSSGTVDHAAAGACLRDIGYQGYVSIEQKMIGPDDPLSAIRESLSVLQDAYK